LALAGPIVKTLLNSFSGDKSSAVEAASLLDVGEEQSSLEIGRPFQHDPGLRRNGDLLLDELNEFRMAIDLHASVSASDAEGKIIYANDRFCEICKYSREELLGRDHRIVNSGYHDREFF